MDQQTGLLLGVVGLVLVCGGLLFIGLLFVLRVTGSNLMSFLGLLARNRLENDSEGGSALKPRRRLNLRARAEAAKHGDPTASAGQNAPVIMPREPQAWRPGRNTDPRFQRGDDDDDILGGILDDEEML